MSASKELGCTNEEDLITLEKLPSKGSNIIHLNTKKPYHCMDIDSFLELWEHEAKEGRKVKNPMTNEEVSEKRLGSIWKLIKAKNGAGAKRPVVADIHVQHGWDDQGFQTREVLHIDDQEADLNAAQAYIELVELRRARHTTTNRRRMIALVLEIYDADASFLTQARWIHKFIESVYQTAYEMPDSEERSNLMDSMLDPLEYLDSHRSLLGGAKKKSSSKRKKVKRKHKGINQKTGRLNKGYKYSGKKSKTGLKEIIKVKK